MADNDRDKYKYISLNGTNFNDWKFQTRVNARQLKASGILDGTEIIPTDALKLEDYTIRQEKLYNHISNPMRPQQQSFIRTVEIGDAYAAYRALLAIYEPQTRAAVKQQLKPLISLKQNGREMASFVTDIVDMSSNLTAALEETKMNLIDLIKILVLIDGLDGEHVLLKGEFVT